MSGSYLQSEFLRVFAEGHKATAQRIFTKLKALDIPLELHNSVRDILFDEIRGLYHGNLVVFDGGSSLADYGMIQIIDDQGKAFDTFLHEICFAHYDEAND